MRRDPSDSAKLETIPVVGRASAGDRHGYLPEFHIACDPGVLDNQCDAIQPEWAGQEAVAFPDNWSIGLSFFHNLFVREHNIIVDSLRDLARKSPNVDSRLRDPDEPAQVINYGQLSNHELFETLA